MSLAGVESTILSPTKTSHSLLSSEERERQGIADGLLRFSVGIENKKDLIEIPKNILNNIKIQTVKTVDEVIKIALTKELKPVEWMEVEVAKSKDGEKISTLTN